MYDNNSGSHYCIAVCLQPCMCVLILCPKTQRARTVVNITRLQYCALFCYTAAAQAAPTCSAGDGVLTPSAPPVAVCLPPKATFYCCRCCISFTTLPLLLLLLLLPQELLTTTSSLKAALQQRDSALSSQAALLEQQGNELECCQGLLQEAQEQLAAVKAGVSVANSLHDPADADEMWARGQVSGLLALNEQLQRQLEQQDAELQRLRGAAAGGTGAGAGAGSGTQG